MAENVLFGRIEGTQSSIQRIMVEAAIGTKTSAAKSDRDKNGIPLYRVWFGLSDGMLNTLGSLDDQSVATYNTYFDGMVKTMEVGGEIEQRDEPVCQAYFKYFKFLERMDLVAHDEDVAVEFLGQPGDKYASKIRIKSDLQIEYAISGQASADQKVPRRLLGAFDDDNVFNVTQEEMGVTVNTSVSEMNKIINVIDKQDKLLYYPISSDGGELTLDAEISGGRTSVSGSLPNSEVENDTDQDLENRYHNGFKEVFTVLNGSLTLHTYPPAGDGKRGGPLQILQSDNDAIRRYILAPTKKN